MILPGRGEVATVSRRLQGRFDPVELAGKLESPFFFRRTGGRSLILVDAALTLSATGTEAKVSTTSENGRILLAEVVETLSAHLMAADDDTATFRFPRCDDPDEAVRAAAPTAFNLLRAVVGAIRVADQRSLPANRQMWEKVRDEIYTDVMRHGWCTTRQAFVQHYGSDSLDAANLILPLVYFLGPNDPRMLNTLDAICKDPGDGGLLSNSLVYRYNTDKFNDGLAGGEGTFNMCTFWLVEALTHAGRMDRRRFALWSAVGAVLWVLTVTLLGYFLGKRFPGLAGRIDKAILVLLLLTVIPLAFEWWRRRRHQHAERRQAAVSAPARAPESTRS